MTNPPDPRINDGTAPIGSLLGSESSISVPKLARQFGWISGGKLLGAVIQAATLVLLARWAGPVGFGSVGVALSLIVVFQTSTDLGLPTYIIRERAAAPGNPTIRRSLQINNQTARLMAILIALAFLTIGTHGQTLYLQLLPLAVWAAVDRNTATWLGVVLADGDAWMNTVALLSLRGGAVLGMIGLYVAGMPPLLSYAASLAMVGLVGNNVAHRCVNRRVTKPTTPIPIRPILRSARPYWINSAACQMRNFDVLIVGAATGGAQAAFYVAASKITGPLGILPTSLATILVPATARAGVTSLRSIRTPVIAMLGTMTLIYLTVTVSAPWLIPWSLGADYKEAVIPVQIVCTGLIFAACASICAAILQGLGQGSAVARITVVTTGLCLVGVFVGSLAGGAQGAATSLATSFLIQAIWLARVLSKSRTTGIRTVNIPPPVWEAQGEKPVLPK